MPRPKILIHEHIEQCSLDTHEHFLSASEPHTVHNLSCLWFFVKRPMWLILGNCAQTNTYAPFYTKFCEMLQVQSEILNWGRNEFKCTYTMQYIQIGVCTWFFILKSSLSRRDYLHTIKYAANSVLKRPVSLCKVLINFFICNEKL